MESRDVYVLIGIVTFVTISYILYDVRNEIPADEISLAMDGTIEKTLRLESVNVSSAAYLAGNYSIGAANETDFLQKARENKIKTVYFAFERGEGKLTKEYWGLLPNGTVGFKRDYMPIKKSYLGEEPGGMGVFKVKNYDDQSVTFKKLHFLAYYPLYLFAAAYIGLMAGVLAYCLSFIPGIFVAIYKAIFNKQ